MRSLWLVVGAGLVLLPEGKSAACQRLGPAVPGADGIGAGGHGHGPEHGQLRSLLSPAGD